MKDGIWGSKASLHFNSAHLNHQRLKLGLTGNSTKGSLRFSSDRNHLFKVAHPIVTGCNHQGRVGLPGLRPASSRRRLSRPTWCPAICAIAGRTRPLATDFAPQLGLAQTPPGRRPAAAGPGNRKEEAAAARGWESGWGRGAPI